ncbi:DMT family transporter [Altericista sp. CCNU0014]|uniref:DMT family transporter n=1 Tax=Altericista sp. CCNU0014 TaxID=3082949 RepID=UPI00384F80EC
MNQPELPLLPKPRADLLSILKLCCAILAISSAPIFIRFSETGLGPNGTVFNRLFIFALVFGSIQSARLGLSSSPPESSPPEPMTGQFWALLLGVGVMSVFSLGLWATSLEYISVAKSMLLNNLTPIFTTLGSWLLFGKRFDTKFLVGMTIALSGAIVLGAEDLNGADNNLLGDGCALLSAVFLAAYLMMVEKLRNRFSATTILLSRAIVGSMVLLPVTWLSEGQVFPATASVWAAVVALGIICEGFGQRLLADSMSHFSCSFIALVLLMEPILSAILAWTIFAEQLGPVTWVSFAVVLTGIYIATSSPAIDKAASPIAGPVNESVNRTDVAFQLDK